MDENSDAWYTRTGNIAKVIHYMNTTVGYVPDDILDFLENPEVYEAEFREALEIEKQNQPG